MPAARLLLRSSAVMVYLPADVATSVPTVSVTEGLTAMLTSWMLMVVSSVDTVLKVMVSAEPVFQVVVLVGYVTVMADTAGRRTRIDLNCIVADSIDYSSLFVWVFALLVERMDCLSGCIQLWTHR